MSWSCHSSHSNWETETYCTPGQVHHGGGGGGGGGGGCPGNSSAPECKSYTVSGAGTAAANGIYKWVEGGTKYGMPSFLNKDGYELYRLGGVWRLVIDGHLVYPLQSIALCAFATHLTVIRG